LVLILKQPYHFGGKIKGCIHHCPASTNVYSTKPINMCKKARKIASPHTNHLNTVDPVVCTHTFWSMSTMSKWIRGFFSLLPLYSQVLETLTWTLYKVFMGRSSDNGVILPCNLLIANCYYLLSFDNNINKDIGGYITCIAILIIQGTCS